MPRLCALGSVSKKDAPLITTQWLWDDVKLAGQSAGLSGFPGRASRHWQVFRQVCTATSANRTNLDNAVGLLGRT